MMHRTLFLLTALALALAGCTTDGSLGDRAGDANTILGGEVSTQEAQALLASAVASMPERFKMEMRAVVDGADALTMVAFVDNATGRGYFEITADPAALGEAEGGEFLKYGIGIYASPDGALYLVNGTAFVFPPGEDGNGFLPSPEESPFAPLMDVDTLLQNITASGAEIKSVRPLTHRGKSAVEIVVENVEEDFSTATFIVFAESKRLAHIEGSGMQVQDDVEEDALLANATFMADFYYDDEVDASIPQRATRALALSYSSDANPFGNFGGEEDENVTVTWTFLQAGGVPLDEVEVVAKGSSQDESDAFQYERLPTLWSMGLAEGTRTEGGVTVTFTDADGDGLVSPGDTLVFEHGSDVEAPTFALRDTVTGTYVVPGAGLWMLLAGLGGAAFVARRR